jgi:hypothetical protein
MGSTTSKVEKTKKQDGHQNKFHNFMDTVKQNVEDEIAKKLIFQREIQLAINMAKARDTLMVYGSAWFTVVTGTGITKFILKKPVPSIVGIPIVIGGLVLGNIADMAYGNKLNRVVKEAESILEYERGRLVPPSQTPFAKFYTTAERNEYYHQATPVSQMYPNALFYSLNPTRPPPSSK